MGYKTDFNLYQSKHYELGAPCISVMSHISHLPCPRSFHLNRFLKIKKKKLWLFHGKKTHVTLTGLDSTLNRLCRQLWPRFSHSSTIMPHDCTTFSTSGFPRKPVPPVTNITRPPKNFCTVDAIFSSSKQK